MADQSTGAVRSWTVGDFIDAVADEAPTPGGGAVAGPVTAEDAAAYGRYVEVCVFESEMS
jgi:formiminotetrahydrofolate cyclodeaminase